MVNTRLKLEKPKNIYTDTVFSYNYHIERLKHAYDAYITELPILIGINYYLPETLKEYFKVIKYNFIDKRFDFIIHTIYPEETIRFYVKVNECKNFIGMDKYDFELQKIEYYYKTGRTEKDFQEHKLKIKKQLSRYMLLESIFSILNDDGSLEIIYKSQL